MPVKMTGADFKAFMAADWGPDAMWEDEAVTVDDVDFDTGEQSSTAIPDAARVVLTGGDIYQDQNTHDPPISAEGFARRWLKARSTASVLVEVPRDKLDELKALLKAQFPSARVA